MGGEGYECQVFQPDPPETTYTGPTVPTCGSGSSKFAGTASGCIATPYTWTNGPSCPKGHDTGRKMVGNPIDLGRGNKYQRVVDFATPGPDRLAFVRHYNSHAARRGSLGIGWTSTYDRLFDGDDLFHENQTGLNFGSTGKPSVKLGIYWYSLKDSDLRRTVLANGDVLLIGNRGVYETYDGTTGALKTLTAPGGYQQTLAYDIDGRLATVTDSHGRELAFAYNADGLVETMTDPDGRVYHYAYEAPEIVAGVPGPADRLREAVYPDDTPGTAADNPRQVYLYEDARHPYALTGITDENGVRFATWAYDDDLRGVLSEHAGGAERTTIAYDDANATRTVTNALGKQTTYHFTTLNAVPKVTLVEGHASANCGAADREYTYTSKGFVASAVDWNGVQTNYVHSLVGLETSRTEAVGTPEQRTITTSWNETLRLPTRIVAPGRTTDLAYDADGRLLTRTETDTTSHGVPYTTNGQTRTWTYGYDGSGRLATVDGPRTGDD